MANATAKDGRQMQRTGADGLEAARAEQAGTGYEWHFGRVTRLGHFELAGGHEVGVAASER